MKQYQELLIDILENGIDSGDRTGVGTRSVFGRQLRFDLNKGFPLVTGKHTSFKLIAAELLWFISGSSNNEDLKKLNGSDRATIWEEWCLENGDLGPIYGFMWRYWDMEVRIDQLEDLITSLKSNPNSRRHVVSAWNALYTPEESLSISDNINFGLMALAPCHVLFQCYVREGRISLQVYLRSSDSFLGLPFNVASYALLTHLLAEVCGFRVGELIVTLGDAHIYNNHREQVDELLSRYTFDLPELTFRRKVTDISDFKIDDFVLLNYVSHPAIKAPVAV